MVKKLFPPAVFGDSKAFSLLLEKGAGRRQFLPIRREEKRLRAGESLVFFLNTSAYCPLVFKVQKDIFVTKTSSRGDLRPGNRTVFLGQKQDSAGWLGQKTERLKWHFPNH
jgi:hypothetical protein